MELRDSRRLTGPNVLSRLPGAVLDVALGDGDDAERVVAAWRVHARRALAAVGWPQAELADRRFHGGLSLALSAPIDALYAATEVNELAWEAAAAELGGAPAPEWEGGVARLRAAIAAERKPAVVALQAAARERGVAFLWDDEAVSVGMGTGAFCWPATAVPPPAAVDWGAVHDVPVALVTGTNGKTTTVRLLAAMVRAAGKVPGISSTEGVWVAGEEIGAGDYSGPGGARLVLRDRRVEAAVLETARGGMLRRGLALERADVALVTNVAEDHLGEWGIHDLGELVETKLIVARGTRRLVLNADDPRLRAWHDRVGVRRLWFALDPRPEEVAAHVATGGETYLVEGGAITVADAAGREAVARLDEVPITFGGAARHNVANALAAVAVARQLRLPLAAIRQALRTFGTAADQNPGRLNAFDLGGVRALVDFAHNPHGLAAVLELAATLPAARRLVVVGQAGDRDDAAIRDLVRLVWQSRPDKVLLKELPGHLRGRPLGEVPALMAAELRALGAPEAAVERVGSELAATRRALAWARPGDLLLLLAHEERDDMLTLLAGLEAAGWRPGEPVPE